MPQQINFYTPDLSNRQRFFSARVMVQALAVLGVVGALLGLYQATRLHRQSQALRQTLRTQAQVLDALRVTTRQQQAAAVPVEQALAQDLVARRAELLRLQRTLTALQQGVLRPGEGHGARLALVARSIPATAWVTLVKADAGRFEVSGFTLDPVALDTWIHQLTASPLLTGRRLAAVNVTQISEPVGGTGAGRGGTPAAASRPVWSFNFVNTLDPPRAVVTGQRP